MAQPTLIIIEVSNLKSSELNKLMKKTYAEIEMEYKTIFCVPAHKAEEVFPEHYENIIPYCQKIVTADNVGLYVARKKQHLIGTEEQMYRFFSTEGAKDNCYLDITAFGGERFKKLCYINWCKDTFEKKTEYRIPKITRKNHRLFYVAT